MQLLKNFLAATLAVAFLQAAAWAKPIHFRSETGNAVSFTSDAPLELISGTTTTGVTGEIQLDDSFVFDAKHPFKISFTVKPAEFKTGIELRDQHMRDKYLETAKFPRATFTATNILVDGKPDLNKAQTVKLTAMGDFTMHGVTTPKSIPLTVHYQPAAKGQPATVQVKGKFNVKLADHDIARPQAAFQKIAETIYITLDLKGTQVK